MKERMSRFAEDPLARELGIELVEMGEGYARTRLRLEDRHLNFNGAVHGAVIFALADAAFAAASNSRENVCAAIHVSIDFLRVPRPGSVIYAECREDLLGKRAGHYGMRVIDEEGEEVALLQGWVHRSSRLHPD